MHEENNTYVLKMDETTQSLKAQIVLIIFTEISQGY